MSEADVEEIRLAGLLHDIGKVGIPEAILNKTGPLSASEWDTMKTHAELGEKILEPLVAMRPIGKMVRHHHEFYDGDGISGQARGREDSVRLANHRDRRRVRHDYVRADLQKIAHAGRGVRGANAMRGESV